MLSIYHHVYKPPRVLSAAPLKRSRAKIHEWDWTSALAAGGGLATPLMARISQPQRAKAAAAAAAAAAATSLPAASASSSADSSSASASAEEEEVEEGDVFVTKALLSSGVLGCTLTTQYRSHAAISDWASREMYGGRLSAAEVRDVGRPFTHHTTLI